MTPFIVGILTSGDCRLPFDRVPDAVPSNAQHFLVCLLSDCARYSGVARFLLHIPIKSGSMEHRGWTGYLGPTEHRWINEFVGLLVLTFGILLALSLVSFNPGRSVVQYQPKPPLGGPPIEFCRSSSARLRRISSSRPGVIRHFYSRYSWGSMHSAGWLPGRFEVSVCDWRE